MIGTMMPALTLITKGHMGFLPPPSENSVYRLSPAHRAARGVTP
jgi:hypothetical protein